MRQAEYPPIMVVWTIGRVLAGLVGSGAHLVWEPVLWRETGGPVGFSATAAPE